MIVCDIYCHTSTAIEDRAGNLHYFQAGRTYESISLNNDIFTYDPQVGRVYGARDIFSLGTVNMPDIIGIFWGYFSVMANDENENKMYGVLANYKAKKGTKQFDDNKLGRRKRKRKNKRQRKNRRKNKSTEIMVVKKSTDENTQKHSCGWPSQGTHHSNYNKPKTREEQRKPTIDKILEES